LIPVAKWPACARAASQAVGFEGVSDRSYRFRRFEKNLIVILKTKDLENRDPENKGLAEIGPGNKGFSENRPLCRVRKASKKLWRLAVVH